jgi:hypothetical protein
VDFDSQKILAIYRNWRQDDQAKQRRVYFSHRRFLPGFGFYGFGFTHIIGGLSSSATGALRALLDAGHFANNPGGLRSKDAKIPGGRVSVGPGEWPEVECSADELKSAFFPLPYKEPSETLFKLLEYLDNAGQRYASITDAMVGEGDTSVPVGTTLARIEQGAKIFSAIHKRLREAMAGEFSILAELNAEFLPQEYPYDVPGEARTVYQADFDKRIDVIPVSDPNIVSNTQRIALAQAQKELSTEAPDLFDRRAVYHRMLEALRVPNIDEVMPPQDQVPHQGPVAENMAMMMQSPVRAFPDQDHLAHYTVHQSWFQGLDPKEVQPRVQGAYWAHQAEHLALGYMAQMLQAMGGQIPPEYLTSQAQIPPEVENQIAVMAATVTQLMAQAPQPHPDEIAAAAQANVEDAKAAADIRRKDAVASADMQREDAKTLHKMQLDNAAQEAQLYQQSGWNQNQQTEAA